MNHDTITSKLEKFFSPDIQILHDEKFNVLGYQGLTTVGNKFILNNGERFLNAIGHPVDIIFTWNRSGICFEYIQKEQTTE